MVTNNEIQYAINGFIAIKLHFQEDKFDYFKYHKKAPSSLLKSMSSKSNICHQMVKILKKYSKREVIPYFVSNFVGDHKLSSPFSLTDDSYIEWRKYVDRMSYNLPNDFTTILQHLKNSKERLDILELLDDNIVRQEPFILFNYITGGVVYKRLNTVPEPYLNIWKEWEKRLDKYKSFIYYDDVDKLKTYLDHAKTETK